MDSAAELAIRLRRAAFNNALAAKDLNAISSLLTPGAILVTGTDSAVITGRKAQLAVWKREFSSGTGILYGRMPGTITPSPIEPIAMEEGTWQGTERGTAKLLASGIYSAKWREISGSWCIEAEIYLSLAG